MEKESKVKDGNYYVVQSFMVKQFGLKGLEKDLYAIIYGFSQAEQTFKGSLQYLSDWTNSSKQGILKALNSLIDKKLIDKKENTFNGIKLVEYYATEFNGGSQLSLMGSQQSLTNNINDKINNKIDNSTAVSVLDYLNEKAGTKFKPVECNLRFITARLKDYSVDDLKAIIDKKYKEWYGTEMQQYLRPKTLFNQTNCENYTNSLGEVKNTPKQSHIEYDKQTTQQEAEDFLEKLREKECAWLYK